MLKSAIKRFVPIGRAHPFLRWPILGLLMLAWGVDCAWRLLCHLGKEAGASAQRAGLKLRRSFPLAMARGREAFHASRQWCLARCEAVKSGVRADLPELKRHISRRAMAVALCVILCLGMLPVGAFAAEWQSTCPHDLGVHDEICGYVEAVTETPCDNGCLDGAGAAGHAPDCAYAPAEAGQPCLHVHDESCGGLIKTADDAYTPDNEPVSVRSAPLAYTPTPEVEVYSEAIYAKGAPLVIEAGTTSDYTNIFVDTDGNGDKGDNETWLTIGTDKPTDAGYDLSRYTIYGGGKYNQDGGTSITMTGGKVKIVYGGGDGDVTGSTSVTITGGYVEEVYGGGKDGDVTGDTSAAVSGGKVSMYLCGGGGQGNVTGSASVSVSDTAQVNYVYGGSYGDFQSGTVGSTQVTVSGGKVSHDLYGGGKGDVTGRASVTISGGTVATVYGGGGSTTGSTQVTLSGGQGRNVYGGGRYDTVTGTANVSMTGGVFSSIYGGGLGSTVGGAATVAVTGGEIKWKVYGGGEEGTNPTPPTVGDGSTVTVGGTARIGTENNVIAGVIINGGTGGVTNGVASFAISPALADGALVKISLPAGYDLSGSTQVVTGAAEGDMSHLTLSGDGGAGKELVLDGTAVKVRPPAPTIPTATPEFYEGANIQRASDNSVPFEVDFFVQNSYVQGTVYQLYTSADGSEQPQGITAQTYQYRGDAFAVTGITERAVLWVSATEPGKLESGRVKIIVLPNFPGAEYSNLYLKTAQELADYLNYCEPGSATVSGDTVTMSRDVMTLHYLYFGRTSPGQPGKSFPYQGGTLDMNGHALCKGPELASSYVFSLPNAESSLTLRGGRLYDTVSFDGTLLLEDCRLESMFCCLMGGGRAELTGTTVEIVDRGQSEDPDFWAAATCALQIGKGGSLTIHTGTLKNAFAAGCTYVGTQPLADCIAQGSVSVPANSSAYDGDFTDWNGMQACRGTVTVTPFDPDAYRPINGGVTVDNSKNIYANGNAVTIAAGTEAGKTNLYYTNDPKRALISLPGMGAADGAGYDLKEYAVWGGGRNMGVESSSLTMTGGAVRELLGGGWACNVSGTATVTMTGGKAQAVSAGGSSDGDAVYTVARAAVEISGGAAVNSLSGSGGNGAKTPIGACDMTVTGEAEITMVTFGNAAQPSLTVGGNARIMALVLNTEGAEYGVDSFAIDPDLGAGAAIGLLFYAPLTAGRVVATGAAAGDLDRISIYPDVESAFGPHRIWLDGASIKCEPLPTYAVGGTVTESGGQTAVSGAAVKLMRGKTQIAAKTTGADGKYNFTKVPAGVYNVVVTKDGKTVTRLITVTDADLTNQNLTMPSENKNSVIEVKDDTPAVVVGGLDKIAEDTELGGASSVTVKLTVEAKEENAAANAGDIKALAGNKTVGDFLDLSLNKVVEGTGAGTTSITDTGANILEIIVPYDFTGKQDVAVYRYHDTAQALIKANTKADGTFQLDEANGLIYIYAAKFSTYAIAYTPAGGGDPTPPTPPVDNGGSDGGTPSYKPGVTMPEHGSVTVTPTYPSKGDKVTVTAKPDAGYEVERITVTDQSGKTVAVTGGTDGKYTFTQPGGKVTIDVRFKSVEARPAWGAFTDVSESDWFYESVKYVYEKGLMRGTSDTTFSPYLSTSRGMIVTILWRLEGAPEVTDAPVFPDVAADAYCAEAVAWADANGIAQGYSDGNFGPNDPITREQLAVMLYRYAQYKGQETPTEGMAIGNFADGAQVSAWARDAMRWCLGTGIVSGKGGNRLDPQGTATRAQAAAMLQRYLEHTGA